MDSHFNKSRDPATFLYYENGAWFDFESDVAESLRTGFMEQNVVAETVIDGATWLTDFSRMVQTKLDCGDQRSVAWIDADGKCFFPYKSINGKGSFNGAGEKSDRALNPKLEIELNSSVNNRKNVVNNEKIDGDGSHKIEIKLNLNENNRNYEITNWKLKGGDEKMEGTKGLEVGIMLNSNNNNGKYDATKGNLNKVENEPHLNSAKSGKRKREGPLEGSDSNHEVVSPRWPRTRVWGETERAYLTVKDMFLSTIRIVDPGASVTGIHQVMRSQPLERGRLEVFKKQMELTMAARGGANMACGWYGAREEQVEVILKYGFCEPSQVPRSESYGVGAYLSPMRSAHSSALLAKVDSYGEKHVILCRVIRGRCEKIEVGSQQMYPSSVDFDTGVDDLENPKWVVVWGANMNTHLLPECVVSYRPTTLSQGLLRGTPAMKTPENSREFFANLFAKLGSTLPSQTVDEFRAWLSAYKEGRMPKGCFVKLVRSAIGDETLKSAIQEVLG